MFHVLQDDKGVIGGGGGIRTHGSLARSAVFETAALVHYATPPDRQNVASFYYTIGILLA